MTRSEVEGKVEYLLDAWNRRDLDAFVAQLAPDVSWHDLGMAHPPAIGTVAVRQFSESVLSAFPDFRYEMRAPVCIAEDGLSCCVPWSIAATHTAILDPPGFAPTNRHVEFDGLDYFTFRDNGLVQRIETRFDPLEAASQLLGFQLRPMPGSWRERSAVFVQRVVASIVRRKRAQNGGTRNPSNA
ncbi:MAG: ester cyclase [Gemmatimonadota bacterium]